jgi:hypothetical protein
MVLFVGDGINVGLAVSFDNITAAKEHRKKQAQLTA